MKFFGKMFYFELCFLTICVHLITRTSQAVIHPRFATKTSYSLSVELDKLDGFYDLQNSSRPQQCTRKFMPVHLTAILRHGTRYPSLKDVKQGRNLLLRLREASMKEALCIKLNDILDKFPPNNDKNLVANGFVENIHLGYTFGSKFSNLFHDATENEVTFYATSINRTVDSFKGFLRGFQDGSDFKHNPNPIIRDDLLRFFDYCEKYVDGVDKNKSAIVEAKLYIDMKQAELNHLLESITNTRNLNVTVDELGSLLDVAGSEDAIFNTRNWLEIVLKSEEMLDILNYASDVEDYWKKGPGYAISYEQSCVLVSYIFKMFDTIIAGDRSKRGAFYFSHAETLYPVFGLLGLFTDDIPLYHNNSHLHKNRAFKSFRISPFAGNIAFVLYECESEMFIELLFKERPLTWPACGDSICPYKDIRTYLSKYIDNCNFQEMCREDQSSYKNVEP